MLSSWRFLFLFSVFHYFRPLDRFFLGCSKLANNDGYIFRFHILQLFFFFFSCLNISLLGKSKIPYLTNFHLVYDDNFWPRLVELSTFQSRIHFYSLLFFWTASGLRTTKSVIIIIITDDILLLVPRFEAPPPPKKSIV